MRLSRLWNGVLVKISNRLQGLTDFQKGNRYKAMREPQRAIDSFLRHAQHCPGDAAKAYAAAAECHLELNTVRQPRPVTPGIELVFEGDKRGAEKYFRLALAACPEEPKALWGIASLLPDDSRERAELLERLVAVQPTIHSLLALADFYRDHLRDLERACQVYLQAQQHRPKDETAYLRLRDICESLNRHQEAQAWQQRWHELKRKAAPA
jgi:tetratricopeptide (TPR) repeat protein